MDLSEILTTHSCHYAGPQDMIYKFLRLTDRLSRPETQISGIVPRCASHPGAKQMHFHFFTFLCSFCSCAGLKPRTSPEAAMGDGVGPLNEALESVTTE